MQLNIKNDEAHRLATQLAELTGESLTAAVTNALRAQLARARRAGSSGVAQRLMDIGRRFAELPDTQAPPRTPEEILGYDETGLPT